jgi:ribosomal protein S18 acetylase RimI-like enzyme
MIRIVPAQPEDVSLLVQIGRRSLVESHGSSAPPEVMKTYLDEKFTEAALAEELADEANIFHLVYYNGEPAGYSKIIYNSPITPVPSARITKLERLYLLSEFYDKKLGHQLLQFNINLSKSAGQEGMWLYVWKENERAMRFYNRAGFIIVGDGFFRLTAGHANPNWQMFLKY